MSKSWRRGNSGNNTDRGPGFNIWAKYSHVEQVKIGDILLRQVVTVDYNIEPSPFGWVTGVSEINHGYKIEYRGLFDGLLYTDKYESGGEQVLIIRNFAE